MPEATPIIFNAAPLVVVFLKVVLKFTKAISLIPAIPRRASFSGVTDGQDRDNATGSGIRSAGPQD